MAFMFVTAVDDGWMDGCLLQHKFEDTQAFLRQPTTKRLSPFSLFILFLYQIFTLTLIFEQNL